MTDNYTNKDIKYEVKEVGDVIHLMEIYLTEWCHRDSWLWKQMYTWFFAGLVVDILPFTTIWNIDLTNVIPKWIFPIVGIIISIFFSIMSGAYTIRLAAVGKTYANLIETLPTEMRRIKIADMGDKHIFKLLNYPMTRVLPEVMMIALMALSVTMLILCIGQ